MRVVEEHVLRGEAPRRHGELGDMFRCVGVGPRESTESLSKRRVARHKNEPREADWNFHRFLQEARHRAVVRMAQRDASCQKRRARGLQHQRGDDETDAQLRVRERHLLLLVRDGVGALEGMATLLGGAKRGASGRPTARRRGGSTRAWQV